MKKTNTELKKIAQCAFESEYGVKPTLKQITLLEASRDGEYVMFAIGKHEYQFNSKRNSDGSIWVGSGTLTMYA